MKTTWLLLLIALAVAPTGKSFAMEDETKDMADLKKHEITTIRMGQENAQFPGGKKAFSDFMAHNMTYPEAAKAEGIEGRGMVRFVVDENGFVRNIQIINSLCDACDQVVVRALSLSPKWIPAKVNGSPVSESIQCPFRFILRMSMVE